MFDNDSDILNKKVDWVTRSGRGWAGFVVNTLKNDGRSSGKRFLERHDFLGTSCLYCIWLWRIVRDFRYN